MENFCFRTSASSLIKRNIVRIYRQKFGYSASIRILRGETPMDPLVLSGFVGNIEKVLKNERGKPLH